MLVLGIQGAEAWGRAPRWPTQNPSPVPSFPRAAVLCAALEAVSRREPVCSAAHRSSSCAEYSINSR